MRAVLLIIVVVALWAIVVDGLVLSAALGLVIVGSLAYNPRLWINDAPPRVRALAAPLTTRERRDRKIVAALFALALIGATAWSAWRLLARHGDEVPVGATFAHFFGVMFLFNLFDLIVIDWLMLLVVRPAFLARLAVAGLSYEETVGGYGYHFRAFLKGMGVVAVFSLLATAATYIAA
jgi:hypothetical protein